jgi:hypothetical protein
MSSRRPRPSRAGNAGAFAVLVLTGSALSADCSSVSYGAGVTIAESTPVSAIVAEPESFVGKKVRVEGRVKDVCEMAGCWLELEAVDAAAAASGPVLKVKVKDGEIEFPVSTRGKSAIAEGEVERLEMDRGKYVRHLKHLAKEQKREFDEASVVGDGPFKVYQIAGTGAEICK